MLRLIASTALALLLAACATHRARPSADVPLLRLAPSALPGGMAEQQRLTFTHGERSDTVDALVEVDADAVRVVIHSQGQVALRLAWDGQSLTQSRAEWLPPQLTAERVLSDLQWVFWPTEAISASLPTGWRFCASGNERTLVRHDEVVTRVERNASDRVLLRQVRHGYQLQVVSVPVAP